MTHETSNLSCRTLVAIGIAAVAVTVAACSGSGQIPSPDQAFSRSQQQRTHSLSQYTFSFQTVDYIKGGSDSRLTGIDQKPDQVLGANGTSSDNYSSWIAHTPKPSSTDYSGFVSRDYPYAGSTYMFGMADAFHQSGTVFAPPPSQYLTCTACGVIFYSKGQGTGYGNPTCGSTPCMWTFIQDPNEGTGSCAATELSGIVYYNLVVGFYKTGSGSCGTQGFEEYFNGTSEYFADFNVPNADPNTTRATGINEEGNVVGSAQFAGDTKGWFYKDAYYCINLAAPQAKATYPLAVNWENDVVGYYEDAKGQTHGFLLTNPTAPLANQTWQTIDEPSASNYTVVSAITTHRYITGWYQDAYGHDHGFVGTCTTCHFKNESRGADAAAWPAKKSQHCMPGNLVWRRRS